MANNNVTDQLIRARELYVQHGITSYALIAKETGLSDKTVSKYARAEQWEKLREKVLTTPVAIAQRLQAIVVKLMDEVDAKQESGQIPNDLTLKRLDRIIKMLTDLDKNYDDKGMMIYSMKRFISYLNRNNKGALIKGLNEILPDFYRSLSEEH